MENKIILFSSPGELFNKGLLKYIKKLSKKKICYVSINKGVGSVKESLKEHKIDSKNFHFIDCITQTLTNPKKESNTHFVSSPKALTELSLAIQESIESSHIILIDSLSTLSVYHRPKVLIEFVYHLAERVRKMPGSLLILPVAKAEKVTEWYKKISLTVDEFVE
jgi:hypothetical protein